jgi:restriction system protein
VVSSKDAEEVAVARRSSVWTEIQRDRALRQRQSERVERIHLKVERELQADATRSRTAEDRQAKALEKQRIEAEHQAALATAAEQNSRLSARVDELADMLRASVAYPPLTVADLRRVELAPFDPGEDGVRLRTPRRPVMQEGGLLGRSRRRRELDEAMKRYADEMADYERQERGRSARLDVRTERYERQARDARAGAAAEANRIENGIADGDTASIEDFARLAIERLPLPDGVAPYPKAAYRPEPRELVVDIRLPDVAVVPIEKSVKYVKAHQTFTVNERSKTEMANIYRGILAQLPLCVLHALFAAFRSDVVDSVTVNGILPAVDRATGRPSERNLVSVTTSRATFDSLVLDALELDPVLCVRELGAKLSPNPLAYEEVPPFLTFELAKYQLGPAVDVAAGLDGRTDLLTMDPFAFEQLVRELLLAMSGQDARVTRRSRDDGIDGVVFDCSATLGGEFIVQAKRYRNVVPANDVRALAGVMHDKRANHALFVTSSWFSDDGRRFARDNRVRLIEGPELRHLLREHLDLDVLIPSSRRRRAAS